MKFSFAIQLCNEVIADRSESNQKCVEYFHFICFFVSVGDLVPAVGFKTLRQLRTRLGLLLEAEEDTVEVERPVVQFLPCTSCC